MAEAINEVTSEDVKAKAGEISLKLKRDFQSRYYLITFVGTGFLTAMVFGYWLGKKHSSKKII